MNERRLHELIDAYGADVTRWPPDERAAAERLLERSDAARAKLEEAATLDCLLDEVSVAPPSVDLTERVLALAPRGRKPVVRRVLAAALPLAVAASVLVWLGRTPTRIGPVPLTEFASLEELATLTDTLLDLVDLAGITDPDLSCDGSTLGCLEVGEDHELRTRATGAGRSSV